eukprot:1146395-Pelagomonas_calceolata.AAC.3
MVHTSFASLRLLYGTHRLPGKELKGCFMRVEDRHVLEIAISMLKSSTMLFEVLVSLNTAANMVPCVDRYPLHTAGRTSLPIAPSWLTGG